MDDKNNNNLKSNNEGCSICSLEDSNQNSWILTSITNGVRSCAIRKKIRKYQGKIITALSINTRMKLKTNDTTKSIHPYALQLDSFQPLQTEFIKKKLDLCQSIHNKPKVYVNDSKLLTEMLRVLQKSKELAIDLMYSSDTYDGYTWLLQISSKEIDYYINAVALRSELHILNDVFTNALIIKIFYKGFKQVQWLQKDFSLYIVNMFDINEAKEMIEQLQFLEEIINIVLPGEAFFSQLHNHPHYYFLFKDHFINLILNFELKEDALREVYSLCTNICKNIYEIPRWNEQNFVQFLQENHLTNLSCQQNYALREISKLRDEIARNKNTNRDNVITEDKMIELIEVLPTTQRMVDNICRGTKKEYSKKFFKIIKEALKLPIGTLNSTPALEIQEARARHSRGTNTSNTDNDQGQSNNLPTNISQTVNDQGQSNNRPENIPRTINDQGQFDNLGTRAVYSGQNIKIKFFDYGAFYKLPRESKFQIFGNEEFQYVKKQMKIESSMTTTHSLELSLFIRTHVNPQILNNSNVERHKDRKVHHPNKLYKRYKWKPQLAFKDKINNTRRIWKPRNLPENFDSYRAELGSFKFPANQLTVLPEIQVKKIEETPFHFIRTATGLRIMMSRLAPCKELAVDVKYSLKRSYEGLTCLLIISTRNDNYIVDALALRSQLHVLNKFFTNSSILKVFFKSARKLLWLQKDLSIFTINMFDVNEAVKFINSREKLNKLPKFKQLINKMNPLKELEFTDWRIRRLVIQAKRNLLEDTHYLLLYKNVSSNELIRQNDNNSNVLKHVYEKCHDICRKTYHKPIFRENSYKELLISREFDGQLFRVRVIKNLNSWRDKKARIHDENPNFILTNNDIMRLTHKLSHKQQDISNILETDFVRKRESKEICKIIRKAKNKPKRVKNHLPKCGPSSAFFLYLKSF